MRNRCAQVAPTVPANLVGRLGPRLSAQHGVLPFKDPWLLAGEPAGNVPPAPPISDKELTEFHEAVEQVSPTTVEFFRRLYLYINQRLELDKTYAASGSPADLSRLEELNLEAHVISDRLVPPHSSPLKYTCPHATWSADIARPPEGSACVRAHAAEEGGGNAGRRGGGEAGRRGGGLRRTIFPDCAQTCRRKRTLDGYTRAL